MQDLTINRRSLNNQNGVWGISYYIVTIVIVRNHQNSIGNYESPYARPSPKPAFQGSAA